MSKNYAFICKSSNIKYSLLRGFAQNKLLIFSLVLVAIIGFLTGIFVAIKCGITFSTLADYNLSIFCCTEGNAFGSFCTRIFSCICNMLILTVSSLYILLIPLGYLMTAYRSYLVGFNCALLICIYGFSGAITSVIVVLPCQIIISLLLIVYFVCAINRAIQKKKFGVSHISLVKIFFLFLFLLSIICLIETILLSIFNANTILVI